jgi:hypothetical protein
MDYRNATLEDVPAIIGTLRELLAVEEETGTVTRRTRGTILRQLPDEVMIAVASELAKIRAAGGVR